tara:strand:+ start:5042 stop:6316 length:1275 start_codon:yes stop_codon:yes gene_type:complete
MKNSMYLWAKDLFPFNRSITGDGVRQTLRYIKKKIPNLKIQSLKSGTKCFDWKVPMEWRIKEAYVKYHKSKMLINIKNNNLHLMGYSEPVNKVLDFKKLKTKLHTLPDQPNAIPYRTSYYKRDWGFCLTHNQLNKIDKKKKFHVLINSKFFKGYLNYGEIFLKGRSKKEILFSTNICHPSLANNEISGPVLAMKIAKYLKIKNRNYSYRIIFIPETIGAIAFLKNKINYLKENLLAGFVLSCVGDDNKYSKISSRLGNTFADRILEKTLDNKKIKFKNYSFLARGSDERQFCSPGVDLPVCSFLRTKHGEYRQYHTSNDNLDYISSKGLNNSFKIMKSLIDNIEKSKFYRSTNLCEPFLTRYKLKKTISGERTMNNKTKSLIDIIAYSDGKNSLEDISKILNIKIKALNKFIKNLLKLKIIKKI